MYIPDLKYFRRLSSCLLFSFSAVIICANTFNHSGGFSLDTEPPVITQQAASDSVNCDVDFNAAFVAWYASAGGAMATDNSDTLNFVGIPDLATAQIQFQESNLSVCGENRIAELGFIAVDTCGNQSIDTTFATFKVIDDTPPVLVTPAQSVEMISCTFGTTDSLMRWLDNHGNAVAVDDCSDTLVWQYVWNDGETPGQGNSGQGTAGVGPYIDIDRSKCNWSVTVVFLGFDNCSKRVTTTAQFSIIDTLPPTFSSMPLDTMVLCDQVPSNDVTATDGCDGEVVIEYFETSTQSVDSTSCEYANYTILREWIAFDVCGNDASHSQTITVIDTIAPTFTTPASTQIICSVADSLNITGNVTDIIENCPNPTVAYKDSIVGNFCPFQIYRIWSVTDLCGNSSTDIQILDVIDNQPPTVDGPAMDKFIPCDSLLDINQDFSSWVSSIAGAVVTDQCAPLKWFAAVPASYDINDTLTFPGTPVGMLNAPECPATTMTYLRSESVDFVFYDLCGNAVVTNAVYAIIDTSPPIIDNCPSDTIITTNDGECIASIFPELSALTDNCGQSDPIQSQTILKTISSTSPGSNQVIVDSLSFDFGPVNLLNTNAQGNISLTIQLNNLDIDDPEEYFLIKGEDGTILDTTDIGTLQCDDLLVIVDNITPAQINAWASDGFITIHLVPNSDVALPVFAINDVCGGSSASVTLTYDIDLVSSLFYQLQIDNANPIDIDTSTAIVLDAGIHILTYIALDCAGNSSQCVQQVTVLDDEAPVINCPDDLTFYTSDTGCNVLLVLPDSISFTDNCDGSIVYDRSLPMDGQNAFLTFNISPSNNEFLAANKLFTFTEVDTITYNTEMPTLRITLTGDINEEGEFFNILGENGEMLGTTALSTSDDCGATSITEIKIPIETFNDFAENGSFELALVSNVSNNVDGGGINACGSIDASNSSDGISAVYASLHYSDATVSYYVDGATTIADTPLDDEAIFLNGGNNEVYYIAQDAAGNADTCSFNITVLDTIAPEIICQSAVVFIDPSGLVNYDLNASEISTSIIDNCGIVDTLITPNGFTCDDIGQEFTVVITVTDMQGNIGSCTSQVKVEMPLLTPTFSSGVCENDTLSLFANVPPPPIANAYSFSWTGPNMFVSNLENPFILNPDASYSGTYILEVEGFGGCISVGTVEVSVDQLVTPEIMSTTPEACVGDEVLLTANSFTGNIEYLWYEGLFPNGILMETTQNASFLVSPPVGEHLYYVIVQSDGCVTNASASFKVDILSPPTAMVNNPFITICEGEEIVLGTDDFNPLYEYFWSGPNDYSEEGQFPAVIQDADITSQGLYSLVIKFGTCISDTATSQVVLFDKPLTPIITGEDVYCEGSAIILSVNNVANADQYDWLLNGSLFTVTSANSLVVNAAQSNLSGEWAVIIKDGICESDTSTVKEISVESQFQISASNDGPGCQGDSVQLNVAFIPNAIYEWTTPQGNTIMEQNPKVPSVAGEYTVVMTTASECTSTSSTTVEVLSIPTITALSNDAQDCSDGTATVTFEPTIVPAGNYTYQWDGPVALDAVANPQIENADMLANGTYTLTVFNGGCESQSISTEINFSQTPAQPIFNQADTIVCDGNDFLISSMNLYPLGLQYFWETPVGAIQTADASLNIALINQNDAGFYILTVNNGDCPSISSDTLFVDIQTIPLQPVITSITEICEGDDFTLTTNVTNADTYIWTGPNGYMSNEMSPFIPEATMAQHAGLYQLTITRNGCSSPTAVELDLSVLPIPSTPEIEQAAYVLCKTQTSVVEICIQDAGITAGVAYELYLDSNFIITSSNGCFVINSSDSFITAGAHVVEIATLTGVCRSPLSASATLQVDEAPLGNILIDDALLTFCDVDIIDLDIIGNNLDGVTWQWESTDDDIVFQNPNSSSTTATGLSLGQNEIILNSSFGACTDYAIDTAVVNVVMGAIVEDDSYALDYNQNAFLDILENDETNGPFTLSIIQQPEFGSVTLINNLVQYTADPNFSSSQTFAYELCNIQCVDNCEVGFVTIEINQSFDCVAPSIITPNGDGYNDNFVIPCFNTGEYQDNEVKIFNEWGDEVFGAKPYQNNWNGTYEGKPLPVGTYFYIVDIGDDSKPLNGFLMIQR